MSCLSSQISYEQKERILTELHSDLSNLSSSINNVDESTQIFKDKIKWSFEAIFNDPQVLIERMERVAFEPMVWGYESYEEEVFHQHQSLDEGVRQARIILKSAEEKLKFTKNFTSIANENIDGNKTKKSSPQTQNKEVFIVHGHDNALKNEVARFVEGQGLKAIILHEQASGGDTIIEKLEAKSDVGFAIILYTPCDVGRASSSKRNNHRARQNVVFEHGYFIGKIGRGRVTALIKGDLELPNDYSGVVYVNHDERGAWKNEIGRELEHAGYKMDFMKF